MAVGKEIKKKIGSVSNTQKITSAMQMVAASKMEGGEIDYTPLPDKNDRWNENARDADDLMYNQSGCY